ncbi:hypothetical protein LTR84_002107 [Exophiala bonariae]|uniref:Shugoshin C-terminal domain-containing protein n=1 Tax=Exophiala bonariae TaxID=1690606 RepID=A0AAV9NBB9_9EURO|nr:hypothetical protein LTR84_002107 [Exophiala bonariae]
MAPLSLTALTPKRQEQHHLSFETASLDGSSSPADTCSTSASPRERLYSSRFTFTPKRTKTVPRAWERRPATPYIARNEAQKIWKRVPLSSITLNSNGSWNKAERAPATRHVKKLKIAEGDSEQDKENINYVPSKWDDDRRDSSSPKRKIAGFIAINRDKNTAYTEAESLATSENLAARALGNTESQDSDLSDREEFQHLDDSNASLTFEQARCSDLDTSDSPMEEDDGLLQDAHSADEVMGDGCMAEDEVIPNIERLDHSHSDIIEEDVLSDTSVQRNVQIPQISTASKATPSASEDETAFLHDFLSRARAQKAARGQPEQPNSNDENLQSLPNVTEMEDELVEELSPIGAMGGTEEPLIGSAIDSTTLPPDTQPEAGQLSPCRRSSRLTTRLPRPQKQITAVPSTIALKRLTGTEFISQNELQSVALMTRTNTKRNKGVALIPRQRLIQLDAESTASPANETTEKNKKKRKKTKEVTWAEQLTSFQTHTPVLPSSAVEEPDQPEVSVASDTVQDEVLPAKSLESEELVTEEEKNKKQVRKVRKLRKLNVGTFNGTPAPKKTISLPVPVASAFAIEVPKSSPLLTGSEVGASSTVPLEGKKDFTTASAQTKSSIPGSETRLQSRMRTRNRTSLAASTSLR